jgi:glycosyltransferase involved in cell wall biosynthesis
VCLSPYNTAPVWPSGALRQVTVIHDLIYLERTPGGPQASRGSLVQRVGRQYRRWVVSRVASKASALVTVSGIMKAALVARFHVDPDEVFVVPNTTDAELFEPYPAAQGERVRLLAVSGIAPHKNLPLLLRCAARRVEEGAPLSVDVLGVSATEGAALLGVLGLERLREAFAFHKDVARAAVLGLYRAASCFVMPSLAEGFGIPLLEALAAGLPAAASDLPVFREIAGSDCDFFDPRSPEAMHAAVGRLVERCLPRRGRTLQRSPSASAVRFAPAAVAAAVDRMWTGVMARG